MPVAYLSRDELWFYPKQILHNVCTGEQAGPGNWTGAAYQRRPLRSPDADGGKSPNASLHVKTSSPARGPSTSP